MSEADLLRSLVRGFEYVGPWTPLSNGLWSIQIEACPLLTDEQRELLDSICDEVAP